MDRKSDSKSNLNDQSTLPLLDDETNKEKIELAEKDQAAKSDEATTAEAAAEADAVDAAKKKKEEEKERKRQQKLEEAEKKKQQKLEKQKKLDEEKELKKQQKAEKKAAQEAAAAAAKANGSANASGAASTSKNWNAYNQFTVGINLLDRDERSVNEHVNVNFEDIIGEPDAAQGFDAAYRLSFGLFQFVRFWVYRILMTILSVPFALLWALIFAVLSLVSVWILTPAFRVLDILFYFVHRLWNVWVRTFLDPIFTSLSLVRQNPTARPLNQTPAPTFSGKSVYRSGVKYNQLSASETVASYTKTDGEDQVALSIESK